MTIAAKIIADSISPGNNRLTTFVLTYPRFIHSEFMTHRMFSRNASSSRAIPVKKSIQMVRDNPAIPLHFRKNQAGMQAGDILENQDEVVKLWLEGRDRALETAEKLADMEVHKQYANRVLEPYSHITVVCSATDYANFFALRISPMAQPEICELATQMYREYIRSEPEELTYGEWHLPFVTEDEKSLPYCDEDLIKFSGARCARVSYLTHEGKVPTRPEDLALYTRLVGAAPIHASPTEHQATPFREHEYTGNFKGWKQQRKFLVDENILTYT